MAIKTLRKNWEVEVPHEEIKKLDKRDLTITQTLHLNSKATLSSIGKQINLSKKNVARRINGLGDKGIITGYHAFINLFKLGFEVYQIKIKPEGTILEKNQYIERISKLSFVNQILVLQSKEGLLVRIAVKYNVQEAIEKLTEGITIISFEIAEVNRISIKSLDIIGTNINNRPITMCRTDEPIKIDGVDIQIIKALCENSRISILDLSRKLKLSKDIISYRKKKLTKEGLIVKYFAAFNQYRLGYQTYILTIELFNVSLREKLRSYLGSIDNTTGLIESISAKAITSFLFFKDVKELMSFEQDLLKKFNDIKKHDFTLVQEQPYYKFFPNPIHLYSKQSKKQRT